VAGWSVEGWRRRQWRGAVDLERLGSLAVTPSPGTGRESASCWPGRSRSMDVLGCLCVGQAVRYGLFLGLALGSWAAEDLLQQTLGLGPSCSTQPRAHACPPTLSGHFSQSRKIKRKDLKEMSSIMFPFVSSYYNGIHITGIRV